MDLTTDDPFSFNSSYLREYLTPEQDSANMSSAERALELLGAELQPEALKMAGMFIGFVMDARPELAVELGQRLALLGSLQVAHTTETPASARLGEVFASPLVGQRTVDRPRRAFGPIEREVNALVWIAIAAAAFFVGMRYFYVGNGSFNLINFPALADGAKGLFLRGLQWAIDNAGHAAAAGGATENFPKSYLAQGVAFNTAKTETPLDVMKQKFILGGMKVADHMTFVDGGLLTDSMKKVSGFFATSDASKVGYHVVDADGKTFFDVVVELTAVPGNLWWAMVKHVVLPADGVFQTGISFADAQVTSFMDHFIALMGSTGGFCMSLVVFVNIMLRETGNGWQDPAGVVILLATVTMLFGVAYNDFVQIATKLDVQNWGAFFFYKVLGMARTHYTTALFSSTTIGGIGTSLLGLKNVWAGGLAIIGAVGMTAINYANIDNQISLDLAKAVTPFVMSTLAVAANVAFARAIVPVGKSLYRAGEHFLRISPYANIKKKAIRAAANVDDLSKPDRYASMALNLSGGKIEAAAKLLVDWGVRV
jgi:hypothetical protein